MRRKFRVGISACLIGFRYRYDGGAKFDAELVNSIRDRVEFVPICPEVECGLAIPRPKMRLEASPKGVRLRVIDTGEDKTEQMREWCEERSIKLDQMDIAAFILKSKSPSCGLCNAKVFSRDGKELRQDGTGLFAAFLKKHYPDVMIVRDTDFPEAAKKF